MTGLARYVPSESTTGYLLRLSRPRFLVSPAGPVVVGIVYAAASFGDLLSPVAVALFAYSLLPATVFLSGVNDVFGADVGAHNPPGNDREMRDGGSRVDPPRSLSPWPPDGRPRGSRTALAAVALCGLVGLAFLPLLTLAGAVAMAGFLLLGLAYSAPPLRFETTPFADSLSSGLSVLPGVAAYAAVSGSLPPLAALVGGWLWTMGMHTFAAVPNVGPTREAGVRTTATLLGERNSLRYCATVWVLAVAAFYSVHPVLGALLAVYPALALGVPLSGVAVDRAARGLPAINAAVGAGLTLVGLWVPVFG